MTPFAGLRRALACLLAASPLVAAPASAAPNVVVIMADELGYGDTGFNGGNSIPTPNLNRIAAGGVVFTAGYAAHLNGSAARAGLLTGRHPGRFGYERSVAWRPADPLAGLPASEKTLAELLRPKGYKSGLIGKWHLGAHDNFHPLNRGFDDFYGFLGGGHRSLPEELAIRHTHEARNEPESYQTWILRGMEPVPIERHLTEELSREALEFVRNRAGGPFFLFLSYNAPRAPLRAPEKDIAAFAHFKDEKRRAYAAMITMMDRGVGQLLDLLDSLELTDNTLLFFLSSTGGDTAATGAYNGHARGMRGEPFEGGLRVPFAVRWPGKIPGGLTYRLPVSALDIVATVAAASRLAPDPARPLDGVDLVPHLAGKNPAAPHPRIYQRVFDADMWSMREGDFKILKLKNQSEPLLFNLAKDPLERTNLAGSEPERVRSLQAAFEAWRAGLIDPVVPGVDMREWTQGARK